MTTVTDRERETMALLAQSTGERISHKLQRRRELVKTLALSNATERYARNFAFYSLERKFAEHKHTFPFLTYVNEQGIEEEICGRLLEGLELLYHYLRTGLMR